jgi:UDP-glucose 4-epimerase
MGVKILLTGSNGYLGRVLISHLKNMEEIKCITGVDNLPMPQEQASSKVKFITMDVRSHELEDVVAGHDVVIHTAFMVQWSHKMPVEVRDDINFNGTRNLAKAVIRQNIKKFIHASSVAAYDPILAQGQNDIDEEFPIGTGDSKLYYSNSKAIAEKILKDILLPSGITLTMLRPSYIIGPNNKTTIQGFRENAVTLLSHDPRAQFVHEDDVAAAFMRAIRTDMPGMYNVVPKGCIRLSELHGILGVKSTPTLPVWIARLITYIRWRFFNSPTHHSWIGEMLLDRTFSNRKLISTGWSPQYDNTEAIQSVH